MTVLVVEGISLHHFLMQNAKRKVQNEQPFCYVILNAVKNLPKLTHLLTEILRRFTPQNDSSF